MVTKTKSSNPQKRTYFPPSRSPFSLLLIEIGLGSFLVVSLVVIFMKIRTEILEKEFEYLDMQILHFLYSYRSSTLDEIMIHITNFGGSLVILLWLLSILLLFFIKRIRDSLLLTFILGMSTLINISLKFLFQRPRPYFYPLVQETDYSFPSGHAMSAFVFYATLAYLVYHITRNKKLAISAAIITSIIIFLIGLSRIYLGVHYPSDVLAGFVAGSCWFIFALVIQKTLHYFKLFKNNKTLDK